MAPSLVQAAIAVLFASSVWAYSDSGSMLEAELLKRAARPSVLPGTWQYQGCYTDQIPRTLAGGGFVNATGMTPKLCIAYCDAGDFLYAGVEYGEECYCGNRITTGTVALPSTCDMPCKGNATEACGGPSRISIFWNGQDPPAGPSHNPGTNGFGLLGCYTEGTTGRALINTPTITGDLTIAKCIAACKSGGYSLAGAEYANECYCGNAFSNTPEVAPEGLAGCSSTCKGNSSEYCGAGNRLNVYKLGYNGVSTTSSRPATTSSSRTTSATTRPVTTAATTRPLSSSVTTRASSSSSRTSSTSSRTTSRASSSVITRTSSSSSRTSSSSSRTTSKASSTVITRTSSSSSRTTSRASSSATTRTSSSSSRTSSSSSRTTSRVSSSATSRAVSSSSSRTSSSSSRTTSRASSSSSGTSSRTSSSSGRPSSSVTTTRTSSSSSRLSSSTSGTPSSSTTRATTSSSSSSTTTTSSSASASPTLSRKPVIGNYTRQGCNIEIPGGRALNDAAFYSFDAMTLDFCATSCSAYTYFGVEYGGECYCGNVLNSASTVAPDAECDFLCPGNSFQYCGAGNRIELYKLTSRTSSTSSVVSSSATTTRPPITATTSATTTSATPIATGLPAGWKYAGCYKEGTTGRALTQMQPGGPTNTIENCINRCIKQGYTVAGMEYSEQCFCDNSVANGAVLANDESKCNMPCPGNSTQMCGAGDILSLYYTGELTVYHPPAVQVDNLPGSWEYDGCYTDNLVVNAALNLRVRGLIWQSYLMTNNSATSCLNLCAEYGYMAGGMQYGIECYCGDHSNVLAIGSEKRPDSECQVPCSGNKSYFCGGNDRNTYYRWTGAPLYTWNTPTGAAKGSYEFLIGGVVVPLITTTGINDKIVFMEKSGTGAPNTTGTYELDLTHINDVSKAWRPLHVQTDIFCAAGVTLPDKAGRQLNIGGWAAESTYGVRLYWPDGSPGVAGTNDWAEDNANLRLLEGRWYPSALNLVNGSVLVIGGQVGSNAAPTPSLEILPRPAGGYAKYLDWLFRTDPDNLYPFLWILPSGGIFIIYYNEARILDERTFDTIKTLPNAPGSVNNFLSGRTYPLEGTAMMWPLFPPYTAPATFMACGGSSEGAGEAIDNCITVQPEVATPKWTIERMPSKRVLSCICALPDGTFLILNGAKSGVAGFGLASIPNLQAVLYDPTKPLNQRMSIMASTIVARMYHSEAILMPDGRVLVSGSNPEDGKNPEEYRVEVFNPPYALNGLPKPTYTISNRDWKYGNTADVKITGTIPSGNLGAVRVSMNAAVSSTHGNSMGQRTIFLAVSCSGTTTRTCSITTPPSAHVAPPGWYQIFLLDGPTPGKGIWIRIGGEVADAAGIGNWPANSKFQKPGLGAVGT